MQQEPAVDKKVEILHATVNEIHHRHCPIKKIRTPLNKPPITNPLITKLKRAKLRAYRKGHPKWKALGKLLSKRIRQLNLKQTNNNINKVTSGSKEWWKAIKSVTGEDKVNRQQTHVCVDGTWLQPSEFTCRLNKYYLQGQSDANITLPNIDGLRADNSSVVTVNEMEIYKHLQNINTSKSVHSLDFPSWISKNNAEFLAMPIALIVNIVYLTTNFN